MSRFPFLSSFSPRRAAALLVLGAACALPAVHGAERDDPYALVHQGVHDDVTLSGDHEDLAQIDRLKKTAGGDFLYFRHDAHAYLVQDPALLARIDAAWLPMKKLGAQMDAYGRQMDQYGRVMDGYGKQMDALGRQGAEDAEVGRQMQALGKQMNEAGKPMDALGKQMAALGREQERAGHDADRAVRAIIREALAQGKASAIGDR